MLKQSFAVIRKQIANVEDRTGSDSAILIYFDMCALVANDVAAVIGFIRIAGSEPCGSRTRGVGSNKTA
jgi:hypothetical protein